LTINIIYDSIVKIIIKTKDRYMKRRIITAFAVMLLTVSLFGCNRIFNDQNIRSISNKSNNWGSTIEINNTFQEKDEEHIGIFTVTESGKVDFDIDCKVKTGSVSFILTGSDDKVILEGSGEKFSIDKKLSLNAGDYVLTMTYDNVGKGYFDMKAKSKSLLRYDNGKEHIIPEKGDKN